MNFIKAGDDAMRKIQMRERQLRRMTDADRARLTPVQIRSFLYQDIEPDPQFADAQLRKLEEKLRLHQENLRTNAKDSGLH